MIDATLDWLTTTADQVGPRLLADAPVWTVFCGLWAVAAACLKAAARRAGSALSAVASLIVAPPAWLGGLLAAPLARWWRECPVAAAWRKVGESAFARLFGEDVDVDTKSAAVGVGKDGDGDYAVFVTVADGKVEIGGVDRTKELPRSVRRKILARVKELLRKKEQLERLDEADTAGMTAGCGVPVKPVIFGDTTVVTVDGAPVTSMGTAVACSCGPGESCNLCPPRRAYGVPKMQPPKSA